MLRKVVKRILFGEPGKKPRKVIGGLFRGLRLVLDTRGGGLLLVGFFEREIARYCRRFASSARTAIDVGAHEGWYSVYFASLPNIVQVYSFEPDSSLHGVFEDNYGLNDPAWRRKTTLVEMFVGSERTQVPRWTTLDGHCSALPGPIVLKIDIDGGELDALKGAQMLLRRADVYLVLETHGKALEQDCLNLLRSLGLTTRIVRQAWYRKLLPEARPGVDQNRWLIAYRE